MKALEKEPRDRYPSAQHLAADLDRFLQNRPVEASRPSIVDRLNRVIRRNAVLASVIALCLVVVTILSVAGSILFAYKSNVAEEQRVQAEMERNRAEQHLEIAREAIDLLLTEAAEELKRSRETSASQLTLLDKAVQFYERFPDAAQAEMRYDTSMAYLDAGHAYEKVSQPGYREKAFELFKRANKIHESLVAENPANPEYQIALIASCEDMGSLLHSHPSLTHPVSGDALTQKSVDLAESLVATNPTSTRYRDALASVLTTHFQVNSKSGDDFDTTPTPTPTARQIAWMAKAVSLRSQLLDESPEDEGYQRALARALDRYAMALFRYRDLDRAEEHSVKSIELSRGLLMRDSANLEYQERLAVALANYGKLLCHQERYEEADQVLSEAIKTYEPLYDEDLYNVRRCFQIMLNDQIESLLKRRRFEESKALQDRFLQIWRDELKKGPGAADIDISGDDTLARNTLFRYALTLRELGDDDKSRQMYAECLEAATRIEVERDRQGRGGDQMVYYASICPFPEVRDDRALLERSQEALKEVGSDKFHLIALGWAQCRNGRYREALHTFALVELTWPKETSDPYAIWTYPDVLLGQSLAYHHTGQHEDAVRCLVLAYQKNLRRDSATLHGGLYCVTRSLLREVLAVVSDGASDPLLYVTELLDPADGDIHDLDPAEGEVLVNENPQHFSLRAFTAPAQIDGSVAGPPVVHLDRDGRRLEERVDYDLDYREDEGVLTIKAIQVYSARAATGLTWEAGSFGLR